MSYLNFKSKYDRFPVINISNDQGVLLQGYDSIIDKLKTIKKGVIVFESYPGINNQVLLEKLIKPLNADEVIFSEDFTISEEAYDQLVDPHLFDDRVFGLYSHHHVIEDFYQMDALNEKNQSIDSSKLTIIYGFGASLFSYDHLVMVSLTRWEIQLRYRNGLSNFKKNNPNEDKLKKYKRGYFIVWRVADRIKDKHMDSMNYLLDLNDNDKPKLIDKDTYNLCLNKAVSRPFRVVPYFDPGVWGGQWMKEVCNLDPSKPNYAWCFDGVPEENSIRFGFRDDFIELPAQDLVQFRPNEFMGSKVYQQFGKHFPIRFDLLDTMQGGNLSLQVHPMDAYIKETFGMTYTQDESYYMLDAEEDAVVYLGVKKGIDQEQFKKDLIEANNGGEPFDDSKYINRIPVKKHDHLLIPSGTVHCSGKNSMVLEISSCVYIFTFKLWDWGRLGLDGLPRPVSLEHGFKNIQFDRDTDFVNNELVNHIEKISDTEEITGLHETEFIESRRYTVKDHDVIMDIGDGVNVCNLVEGQEMRVESVDGSFEPYHIHYAETFYVPAKVKKVKFVSLDKNGCMVIKARVK
jgi:mannose-6-phosphate isomerase class I